MLPPLTPDPQKRLRQEALRLLTRREHSRAELAEKLGPQAEDPADLTATLDTLERERLLSDNRFARQRVAGRAGRYGNARLQQELRQHGVADDDIADALSEGGDETQRCRAVWQKKFAQLPQTAAERAKQMRFLQYRGFSADAIRRTLRGEEE